MIIRRTNRLAVWVVLIASPCFGEAQFIACVQHTRFPQYPLLLWSAGIAGNVKCNFSIAADGKAKGIECTSVNADIKAIAVNWLEVSRFRVDTCGGRRVELALEFKLLAAKRGSDRSIVEIEDGRILIVASSPPLPNSH